MAIALLMDVRGLSTELETDFLAVVFFCGSFTSAIVLCSFVLTRLFVDMTYSRDSFSV